MFPGTTLFWHIAVPSLETEGTKGSSTIATNPTKYPGISKNNKGIKTTESHIT